MNKEKLDLILVPIGVFIMILYHVTLFYRYRKHPENTINGFENECKRQWVKTMMALDLKDRSLAITVCNTHVLAATSLSSISLVLSSLIGVWLGISNENIFSSSLIYGDTGPTMMSVKYIALLLCFLIAFGCFVQTARCYVHAIFLITMPSSTTLKTYNAEHEVVWGSHFWSLGVRAMYFAATLLMWVFGPISMIVSSVIMVALLFMLDTNWSLSNDQISEPSTDGTNEIPSKKPEQEISDVKMNIEGQLEEGSSVDSELSRKGKNQICN